MTDVELIQPVKLNDELHAIMDRMFAGEHTPNPSDPGDIRQFTNVAMRFLDQHLADITDVDRQFLQEFEGVFIRYFIGRFGDERTDYAMGLASQIVEAVKTQIIAGFLERERTAQVAEDQQTLGEAMTAVQPIELTQARSEAALLQIFTPIVIMQNQRLILEFPDDHTELVSDEGVVRIRANLQTLGEEDNAEVQPLLPQGHGLLGLLNDILGKAGIQIERDPEDPANIVLVVPVSTYLN